MRARRFRDPAMQRLYDMRLASPPERRGSGGLCHAYYVGLENPDRPARYATDSLAHAAWAAGVDTARAKA